MEPLITVIVPVYNVETYLQRCIDSILKQTYSNLEILLVDDGSTDNSGALCDAYGEKDARIRVIHQKNRGLPAARNCALDVAKGEYIAFVDSDDYVNEHMIRTLYEKTEQTHADMAICNYQKWSEEEKQVLESKISLKEEVITREKTLEFLFCEQLSVFMPVAWNKLYRRKLWNGLRYPEGKYHEDEYVIHRLIEGCCKVVIVPECLYYYSIRSGSIMATRALKASRDWVDALLDRKAFWEQHGYTELVQKQQELCIRMILWECKKINEISPEARKFIYAMAKKVRMLLRKRKPKGYLGAKIFARVPIFYIKCNRLFV